ncbi:MAG: hypothetical protein Q4B50_05105 [Bacillota bacterium]|nr:hypothetical protein [Bacillota bacterium]
MTHFFSKKWGLTKACENLLLSKTLPFLKERKRKNFNLWAHPSQQGIQPKSCHCEAGKLRACASKTQLGNVAIFRFPGCAGKCFQSGFSSGLPRRFAGRYFISSQQKLPRNDSNLDFSAAQNLKFFDPLFFKKVGVYCSRSGQGCSETNQSRRTPGFPAEPGNTLKKEQSSFLPQLPAENQLEVPRPQLVNSRKVRRTRPAPPQRTMAPFMDSRL